MKVASDELHRLIHSLSKSEKRYLQIYAQRHVQGDKNNYLKLYEAIAQQEVYDERKLKEKFSEEKFTSYLPAAKYYLQNLLLDSLHAFHEASSQEAKLRKKLHQAEILYQKGLISQSRKLLKRLKEQAYNFEKLNLLINILNLEKQIMARNYYHDQQPDDLDRQYQEENEVLKRMENRNVYWHLHGSLYLNHFRKGLVRDEKEIRELDDFIQHPLLLDRRQALTFEARMNFYQIHAIYNFIRGNAEAAYDFNRQFLALMESEPLKMQQFPRRYMATLNNYLIDSLNLKKYEELEAGLKKLRSLPQQDAFKHIEHIAADIFRLSYILDLNAHLDTGRFSAGMHKLPEIKEGLKAHERQIVKHNLITIYYLTGYLCFGAGEFSEALRWINLILNDTGEEVVQDIHAFARIINLLIHFELENHDLLEYTIKSTHRYLKTREKLYEVENLILKFLRTQTLTASAKSFRQSCRQLKTELLPLRQDPTERKAFEYFDIISWLDSKIEGVSFEDVVRGK